MYDEFILKLDEDFTQKEIVMLFRLIICKSVKNDQFLKKVIPLLEVFDERRSNECQEDNEITNLSFSSSKKTLSHIKRNEINIESISNHLIEKLQRKMKDLID